jgi:hypothetical protein
VRHSRNQTWNISRKARKDRQVKRLNFLGAWGWVAFARLAKLAREIPLFLKLSVAEKFARAAKILKQYEGHKDSEMSPAKAQRRQVYEEKDEISYEWLPPLISELCALFAGVIPILLVAAAPRWALPG